MGDVYLSLYSWLYELARLSHTELAISNAKSPHAVRVTGCTTEVEPI